MNDVLSLYYRWRSGSPEGLCYLPKVTQRGSMEGLGLSLDESGSPGAVTGASPERVENIPPLGRGLAGDGLVAPTAQHPLRDPLGAPF